jgi:hypothetical protein
MGDTRPVFPNVIVAVLFQRNGSGLRVFYRSLIERRLNWQNRWDLFPPEVKTGLPELTPRCAVTSAAATVYSTFFEAIWWGHF